MREGCHPSKAAQDAAKRTPLQLAIHTGAVDMIQLMVKYATVHDVEACWIRVARGEINPDEKHTRMQRSFGEDVDENDEGVNYAVLRVLEQKVCPRVSYCVTILIEI